MEKIQLDQYNISIGNIKESVPDFLHANNYSKIYILTDQNTSEHCLPRILPIMERYPWTEISVPAGEKHKNIISCQEIWRQMMQTGADRKALTINLGGGVIGDMGGFCASTFKRGMDFIQIPTTLLSQVDASIGGKLGIDFMQVKNSIGLFRNPQAVLIDPAFLFTLPFAEIRSGYAEIIKHSLIAASDQWQSLSQIKELKSVDWAKIITPSLLIKKQVVEEDPFEKGLRKALNFGHTIGHAIEGHVLETESPLLHGEAIAIGMICETYLSHRILGLPESEMESVSRYILSVYDPYPLKKEDYPAYFQLMRNDKKNEDGKINFSLINPIGSVMVNQTGDLQLIEESLDYYNTLCN